MAESPQEPVIRSEGSGVSGRCIGYALMLDRSAQTMAVPDRSHRATLLLSLPGITQIVRRRGAPEPNSAWAR